MALFRPHRELLQEAMEEVEEINSLDELIKKINDDLHKWNKFVINKNTVHIEKYCYDDRINWDTYIITLDNYGVIGFTNGNLQ